MNPGCPQYSYRGGKVSSVSPLLGGLLGVLLASFFSAPLAAAEAVRDWNRPAIDWYEGPVRYLLSKDEEVKYRALEAEEERARFIEDFWARRDEDPATPINEFQVRFRKRVEEADRLFLDAPYPGWKTDRGKIYVLLGPPDEIRQLRAVGPRGKETPALIWIYSQPRFEGMDRDTQVRFLQDESGEFRITDQLLTNRLERISGASRTAYYQASAAQRPPEPRQVLDTIVAARPPMDAGRFRTHYDFFRAADGSTSVVMTLAVRPDPGGPARQQPPSPPQTAPVRQWKVFARLSRASGSYDLVEENSFRTTEAVADVEGFRLYQGRISVPPGSYTVFYAIQDEGRGELFSLSDRLQVPDFARQEFSVSGIALAARLEPASAPEVDQPFLIGRLLVIPKMDPTYRNEEEFAYYFQVYDPQTDPGSGQAALDITYQFYRAAEMRKTGEATFKPFGEPLPLENQSGLVHGRAFVLKGWPAGEYRLKVIVKDRTSTAKAESEIGFSVR